MYQLADVRSVHLEITSKCQASCPMCARNVQGGMLNPFVQLHEITLQEFKDWFPQSFIQQLNRLYMCGNLGDPIVANDTLEIFEYIRSVNPSIRLGMNTNGSARSVAWWKQLAQINVSVRFGIDGLSDTHHLYRIGTKFEKIIENAKAFIAAGGDAVWDMLVFEHNSHQVEECKQLATDLGFKGFFPKNTARFKEDKLHVLDDEGKTRYVIYPTERSKELLDNVSSQPRNTIIKCKAKDEGGIYVSASGNVTPCCWLDLQWLPPMNVNRIDYMDTIGRFLNLHDHSLKDIFDTGIFNEIENTWSKTPLKECSKQCGYFDKLNEQFK